MEFSFSHYTISNLLSELGEDVTFIHYFYQKNEVVLVMPIILNLNEIFNFIKKTDFPAYQYIQKVRSDIGGYGPKHSKMFEVFEQEGFDMDRFLMVFANSFEDDMIAQHIEKFQIKNNEGFNRAMKTLKEIATPNYIQENLKINNFTEAIDQKLHELTLEFYPEFFEKDIEYLNKYKSLLIDTTLRFVLDFDKLRHQ
jgi:hypothetical protein